MEYLKKCQKCERLRTVMCYGTQKGHRGNCHLKFLASRREYIANLPPGKVTLDTDSQLKSTA